VNPRAVVPCRRLIANLRVALLCAVVACLCGFPGPAASVLAADTYPQPVGYVNDFANVIPDEDKARISAIATELEQKTGAELAVTTVATTAGVDIHDYSVGMYTQWGLGKKGKDDGVLIVAAIEDRKLWIKPGYGLEGTITDAFADGVFRHTLRPAFREGEYGKGLLKAVEVVATAVADAEGVTLATIGTRPELPSKDSDEGTGIPGPVIFFLVVFIVLLVVMGMSRASTGRRIGGPPFWTGGGFAGGLKGGGFGGGFGGFGGGSCGGGGAGGGW